MRVVTFVDTSILVELLAVPGKSQDRDGTRAALRERVAAGETLVLPTAAIVETGNHVAQVGDGGLRRRCAEGLATLLRATIAGEAPWTLGGAAWDADLLRRLCDGARGCLPLPDMASQGVGTGDVSILAEAERFAERVAGVEVRIWTFDAGLAAYA